MSAKRRIPQDDDRTSVLGKEMPFGSGECDMLGSVITLVDEPTWIADVEDFVASWVQKNYASSGTSLTPEDVRDTISIVRRIWKQLNDPTRPLESASIDHRVELVRYLEKLMRAEFASSRDLRQHVGRYLEGYDGRRLPVAKAIKRARKKLRLTQRQLAEKLGLKDHTLISKYESGQRRPSKKVLDWLEEGGM